MWDVCALVAFRLQQHLGVTEGDFWKWMFNTTMQLNSEQLLCSSLWWAPVTDQRVSRGRFEEHWYLCQVSLQIAEAHYRNTARLCSHTPHWTWREYLGQKFIVCRWWFVISLAWFELMIADFSSDATVSFAFEVWLRLPWMDLWDVWTDIQVLFHDPLDFHWHHC